MPQAVDAAPTMNVARLKLGVTNTRRYKSKIDTFTSVIVRAYVIDAGINSCATDKSFQQENVDYIEDRKTYLEDQRHLRRGQTIPVPARSTFGDP